MSLAEVVLMEPEEDQERPESIPLDAVPIFGRALFGTRWQADLSLALGYSKSQLSRILLNTTKKQQEEAALPEDERPEDPIEKRARLAPPNFSAQLQSVMLDRMLEIAGLLDTPGLPRAGTPEMKKAQDCVLTAVRLLRGEIKMRQR